MESVQNLQLSLIEATCLALIDQVEAVCIQLLRSQHYYFLAFAYWHIITCFRIDLNLVRLHKFELFLFFKGLEIYGTIQLDSGHVGVIFSLRSSHEQLVFHKLNFDILFLQQTL